jgi:hypothetical protein
MSPNERQWGFSSDKRSGHKEDHCTEKTTFIYSRAFVLKLGIASWCTNHVLRSKSNGTPFINSISYFPRTPMLTSLTRVQEIQVYMAYWKITTITPDIGAKLLLVVLFNSCLRVFCSDTNIIAVDNTLSIKGSLISVQYNTARRRLTQNSL